MPERFFKGRAYREREVMNHADEQEVFEDTHDISETALEKQFRISVRKRYREISKGKKNAGKGGVVWRILTIQ